MATQGAPFEWQVEPLEDGRSLVYVADSPVAIVGGPRLVLLHWLIDVRQEERLLRYDEQNRPVTEPRLRLLLDHRYASAAAVALSELGADPDIITALRVAGSGDDRAPDVLSDFLQENPRVSGIPPGAIVYSDRFVWPDRADAEAYARRAGFTSRQLIELTAPGVGHGQAGPTEWAIRTSEAAPPYRGNYVGPAWNADTRELVTNASADAGDLNRRAFTWLGTVRLSEVVDAFADRLVMDGIAAQSAGDEGGPQYELLRFDAPRLEEMTGAYTAVAESHGILLTGAELHFIGAQAGAIVEYMDSGSVNVEWVDSDDQLQERWNQIEGAVNPSRATDPNADRADIEYEFAVAHPEFADENSTVEAVFEHGQWFIRAETTSDYAAVAGSATYSVVDTGDGGIDFEQLP